MTHKILTSLCMTFCLTTTLMATKGDIHKGKVLEVVQTPTYTYVQVENKQNNFWAAIVKTLVSKGDSIELTEQVWLENFPSKALNKTFDKILFADVAGAKNDNIHGIHGQSMKQVKKPNPAFNKDNIIVKTKPIIVKNITELYEKKAEYQNKNVAFTATVEQVSNKVMGNTWVKLKNSDASIIFRSNNEDENVKVGDRVYVVGTLNTNVDYGYGFKYEAIGLGATFKKIQ